MDVASTDTFSLKGGIMTSRMSFGMSNATSSMVNLAKNKTPMDNRRLLYDIVDEFFEDKRGVADVSTSSYCLSQDFQDKPLKQDRRLAYWDKVLQDRQRIQKRIERKVGKRPDEIMFNRMTTLDERNKKTIQTVFDYAYRLTPGALINRKTIKLKPVCHLGTCQMTAELEETLPQAEREKCKFVEISGLPNNIKVEMLGKLKDQGKERKSVWLHSQVLKDRIKERLPDLERVVEYYPEIDKLEVIGEGILPPKPPKHDSDINFITEIPMQKISSDTISDTEDSTTTRCESSSPCIPDYALKINEVIFKFAEKKSTKIIESETFFMCAPFEKVVRTVIRLENLGRKPINCEWLTRSYYEKNGKFLKPVEREFLFNKDSFRLFSGECRDVVVYYQPRRVQIVKERYLLKVDPNFFCKKVEAVSVKLHGRCKPPTEYFNKINEERQEVIDKSNLAMMRKVNTTMAEIIPLIKPPERICPYQRVLEEREIFELENQGYKCDRFQDLELLKDIYARIKKPIEKAWDLKIDTLKKMILRLEGSDLRALVLNEMLGIIQTMRGEPLSLDEKLMDNREREKTCLINVKGLVSTAIDDWENILVNVETTFFKPLLDNFNDEVAEMDFEAQPEEEEEEEDYKVNLYKRLLEAGEEAIFNYITKKVRGSKVFRDAALIQTYNLLCNIAEDIVSVVESADIV